MQPSRSSRGVITTINVPKIGFLHRLSARQNSNDSKYPLRYHSALDSAAYKKYKKYDFDFDEAIIDPYGAQVPDSQRFREPGRPDVQSDTFNENLKIFVRS